MSELYFPSLSDHPATDDAPASLAELQGALCGVLCLDSQANRSNWYRTLYQDYTPDEDEQHELMHLFDQTIQALNSLDFDLQLELPDDDAPLPSRLLAMTNWCQGLLFGLSVSGLTDDSSLSADCQEYIRDVINISQLDVNDIEDDDDANFEELVEYLRMGLFLLYNEHQPAESSDHVTEH